MENLNLLQITLETSVIILLVVSIGKLFKNQLNPNIRYFLWIFVALRILVPFKLEVPIFLPTVTEDNVRQPEQETMVEINQDILVDTIFPDVSVDDYSENVPEDFGAENIFSEEQQEQFPEVSVTKYDVFHNLRLKDIFFVVWIVGAACILLYIFVNNVRLFRRLKKERKVLTTLENDITIYAMYGHNCLAGIFHPAIYVDADTIADENIILNVIKHELQHYKVKDNFWQVIRVLCLVMQWYNPFVWWAYEVSKRDCELACDYRVTRNMTKEERYTYGASLLDIMERSLHSQNKTFFATSMGESKEVVKKRIQIIMQSKHKTVFAVALIVVCVIAGISTVSLNFCEMTPITNQEYQSFSGEIGESYEALDEPVYVVEKDYVAKAPSEETVLEVREHVLNGMTEKDIEYMKNVVKNANLSMEYDYLSGSALSKMEDPDSLYWNYIDQLGQIHIGWGYNTEDLAKKDELNLTEEEFNEQYGTKVVAYNEVDGATFVKHMTNIKETISDECLKRDFDALIWNMQQAMDTHDVEYLYQIYRIFHDMDYYLLRYGPTEMDPYVSDMSTVNKFYGVLQAHDYEYWETQDNTYVAFDVMNVTLPDGMKLGEFDIYLAQGGGVPILNADGTEVGYVEIHQRTEGIFENGELVGVHEFNNHALFTSQFENISSNDGDIIPCVAAKYNTDHGEYRDFWYAFWLQEGLEPGYAICLIDEFFDYEDLVTMATSVTFYASAFKEPPEDISDDWGQQYTE